MRLGDLLIKASLVTGKDVENALKMQAEKGGRLGDHLVAAGAIQATVLHDFLHRIPAEPADLAATHIEPTALMSLLVKCIYVQHLETIRQIMDAIKLPYHLVLDLLQMAIDRQLIFTLGRRASANPLEQSYSLTEEGRRWVIDALNQLRYAGPAPVTLEEFTQQIYLQKVTNELVTFAKIRAGFGDLTFDDSMIEQSGPALNSGRAMLLYGPPGNGKTSVALSFSKVFTDVIYVPYAVVVEGQIMRVYDPSLHFVLDNRSPEHDDSQSFHRLEEYDARWVPCKRPFVVTGGELTLEMLDLRYDPSANFYEAPLHVKALGGCFVIDDFGRQLVSPTHLLNRWIVPLESRVDYLKLHTGKTFSVPFEELVIFSTNLEPEDLMDPAFLRRIPYKIEVGAPSPAVYREIFEKECKRQRLAFSEQLYAYVVHKLTQEKGLELAAYQPRFLIDQVVATCRFMGQDPHFEPRYISYALDNLRVKKNAATSASA